MQAWYPLKPHAIQSQYWRCTKRFVGASAARGSGKTEIAKRKLVTQLPIRKPWPNPRYFYGGPTVQQAKRIAWRHFLELIPRKWLAGDPNRSDLCIRTIFGSELWVVGLDKPQRIEGDQWDGGVLDESCDLKPKTFELNVLPALTHRNGWCWRIGVPKRTGPSAPEFREFCLQAAAGEIPDADAFTWPADDILSPEQLAFARSKLSQKDYLEQFGGVWQDIGGGIFFAFSRELNVRKCEYRPDKVMLVGSDFNVDPMCWVLGHKWENRIEWFEEIFKRDTNTKATLDLLYKKYRSHKSGFIFVGDATARQRDTAAAQSDYNIIKDDRRFKALGRKVFYPESNPSVHDRFAACNAMFCNADGDARMFIDPSCKRLIADCEARCYEPGTRIVADEKGTDIGHLTDAMGYPVHWFFPVRVALELKQQPIGVFAG